MAQSVPAQSSASSRLIGLAKYAIGFGLLGFMIWRNWEGKQHDPDGPRLPGLKDLIEQTPNLLPFLIAGLCVLVATGLQFYRWYLLVRGLDLPFTFRSAVRLGMVGFFYNTFLPGSVGGDAVKAYFLIRGQPSRKAAAFATVVADRMFGLFGLVLYVALVGGACWAAGNEQIGTNEDLQKVIKVCGGIAVAITVGWLLLGLLPRHRADRFAVRLQKLPKIGATLAELWYTVWQYRQRSKTVLACLGLSAVTHTCYVLIFHFAVQVFPSGAGDVATLPEHVSAAPIGYIMEALFPAPGGIGGGEAIFGYLYKLLGKPFNVGFVGRLTMRVLQWTFGFIGYLAYLRMKADLPATIPATPPDPAAEMAESAA